jgi:CheY-like chemotaxis protein
MPVMDGVTATRAIRKYELESNLKPTVIIALTGQASTAARLEAVKSGVDHFITKPVRFPVLLGLLTA